MLFSVGEEVVPAERAGAQGALGVAVWVSCRERERCEWRAPLLRPRPPSPAPQAAPWAGGWGLELSAPPRTPTSQQSATAGLAVLGDARLALGREASSRRPSSGRPPPRASRQPRGAGRGPGPPLLSTGRGRPSPAARSGPCAPRAPPPRINTSKNAGGAGSPAPWSLSLGVFACVLHLFAYHSFNVCRKAPSLSPGLSAPTFPPRLQPSP